MISRFTGFLVLVASLGIVAAQAEEGIPAPESHSGPCDLATVVPGFYCEYDGNLLEAKDLVSNVTYFECPECSDRSDAAGQCEDCEVALIEKTSEKDVCKDCLGKPMAVEICVKKAFECAGCGHMSATPMHCEGCDEDLQPTVVKAMVVYSCEECGETEREAGNCTNEDCGHNGKPLARTCESSHEFPHTTPANDEEAEK